MQYSKLTTSPTDIFLSTFNYFPILEYESVFHNYTFLAKITSQFITMCSQFRYSKVVFLLQILSPKVCSLSHLSLISSTLIEWRNIWITALLIDLIQAIIYFIIFKLLSAQLFYAYSTGCTKIMLTQLMYFFYVNVQFTCVKFSQY